MQITVAKVCAVEGGMAEIELSSFGCGRCSEPGGCGGQSVSRALCGSAKRFWVINSVRAVPGDHVRVGIESSDVRQVATSAYVIPLMYLLGGSLLAAPFGSLSSIFGGVVGLALAWYRLISCKKSVFRQPQLTERIADSK